MSRSSTPGSTIESNNSGGSDLFLKRIRKKRVFVERLQDGQKFLEWKESCIQMRRRSRFSLSKTIAGTSKHNSDDKKMENRITLELFDEFCRLYMPLFFLREPHIQNVNNFKKVLKSHIVIEDEQSLMKETLWVCYEDYFEEWFMSKNDATHKNGRHPQAQRGWYLFKHYKNIRNELFLEWEKIFWRPSFTVTCHYMTAMDPSLSNERACCPSLLSKIGGEYIEQCFGMKGRLLENIGGVMKPTLSLDLVFCKENPNEEIVVNPFNAFVKFIFGGLLEILQLLKQTCQRLVHSTSNSLNLDGFPDTNLPSDNELTVGGLMKFGDFQDIFDLMLGYLKPLIALKSKNNHEEMMDKDTRDDISNLQEKFLAFRLLVEEHEMHAFLAMWTFWNRPGQPYLVNFLMRATNLRQFHMLLSEELLGTFLMVRTFCLQIHIFLCFSYN